ncbi:hypothetical protein [Aquimarina pacifica]|uniref:hypothetical protein n=1 Tax=Aquimarina pacifica TaxID=1296415 RepID=UPI00046F5E7A|nr:hypothetical protein [Aquimarina pacifica]
MEEKEIIDKTTSLVDYQLTQNLSGLYANYGCQIIFEDALGKNEVRYKLTIKYIEQVTEFTHRFRVERANEIYINDQPPDTFIDELAYETSKNIYPIELLVNHDGSLLDILNHEHVVSRWPEEKKRIKKYYKGTMVDRYLTLHEKTILNHEKFLKSLKKDWFINLYFSKIYINYSDEYFVFNKKLYPTAGKAADIEYEVKESITGYDDSNTEEYLIKIEGNINDKRCALDIEQHLDYPFYKAMDSNEKDLKGTCNITYMVTKTTGTLEGFEAFFDTKFEEPKKVTVKMYLLEHLEEEISTHTEEKSSEGFWGKFFKKITK